MIAKVGLVTSGPIPSPGIKVILCFIDFFPLSGCVTHIFYTPSMGK